MDSSRYLFTDLKDDARRVRPSYYFMIRSILHSRVDLGLDSEPSNDESVNVYMAHLLQAFGDPQYLESAAPFLHRYDHEVFGRLANSTDARLKYKIYKTNADFLLVSVGIFDNPSLALMGTEKKARRVADRATEATSLGRGRSYYHFAYEYSQLVNREHPGITEVLEKLARGFDRYTRILGHLRGEYMDIVQELSRGEIYHLERTVNEEQEREDLHLRRDAFLDAFAAWRRHPDDATRAELLTAAERVRELDPDFRFDPDSMKPGPEGQA